MSKYFHHKAPLSGKHFYWRTRQSYEDVQLHLNLNLLGYSAGDLPPAGVTLVRTEEYRVGLPGANLVQVQPFVALTSNGPTELPIGANLKNLLDYPLGTDEKMNLSLPFYDGALGIGDTGGGWFRDLETDAAYHCGLDVMPASQVSSADLFDVCAAADGVVEAIGKRKNAPVVLKHIRGNAEFLTVYQHLDLRTCPLNKGDPVQRGQFLAKIADDRETPDPANPHSRHLHFMVAIRRPGFTLPTGVAIPPLWYAIDAFGVYDYYKNRSDRNTYNYVPDVRPDCFAYRVQGTSHTIQWATQPLVNTLPVSRQTAYRKIVRMQFRCRRSETQAGVPPAEQDQCLIWLEGVDDYFFVPLVSAAGSNAVEMQMTNFLSQCFDRGRKVKLEYYSLAGRPQIAAVWAND